MTNYLILGENGTLKVTGYLRGNDISVNALVHIPGLGDYQLERLDDVQDPYGLYENEYV